MCVGVCYVEFVTFVEVRVYVGHEDVCCVDCYMSCVVYGVCDVYCSHCIDVSWLIEYADVGRADACMLCYLDWSLAWVVGDLDGMLTFYVMGVVGDLV